MLMRSFAPEEASNVASTSYSLHVCPACEHLKPAGWTQATARGSRNGPTALELACGTGSSCIFMARVLREGAWVAGVDIVREAVVTARANAVEAAVGDACAFIQVRMKLRLEAPRSNS